MSKSPPPKPMPPSAAATTTSSSTHFDISQLPSLRHGMTAEEESMKRRKTCRFIEEAGRVLKLPRVAVSTAMVFFHRFYAKHSFHEHDRFEVAVAAIVLAAKTEESPKKLNTVILECHKLKTRGMQAGRISAQQGSSNSKSGAPPPPPPAVQEILDPKEEEFAKLKERILLLERVILHTIGFELSIDHPYKFFVERIKKLIQTRQLRYVSSDNTSAAASSSSSTPPASKMMNEMVQYSMSFANDSMHTSLCLQFAPQQIATACIYLAAQFAKIEPISDTNWPKVLGSPDIESFVSICIQILDLIADRKASDTGTVKKIRAQLELLKSREEKQQGTAGVTTSPNSSSSPPPPPPPPPAGSEPHTKRQKV